MFGCSAELRTNRCTRGRTREGEGGGLGGATAGGGTWWRDRTATAHDPDACARRAM